jgi:elongation factor P hydroxylase
MMRNRRNRNLLILCICLISFFSSRAQISIRGKILDETKHPVANASVFIENSLDGCTSDSLGVFNLISTQQGVIIVTASAMGYENGFLITTLTKDTSGLLIYLRTVYHGLDEVTINAGSFAMSDNSKTILKPMDIMTTAGANADIVKVIETLPGAQQNGVSTGLFVRGGDASETSILIDKMVVQNAFFSNLPGVSQSSRFSPFQFKGIAFSSGGYSARFGQALSSVLELATPDLPEKNRISLGTNMTGFFGSGTKIWNKSSLEFSGGYNNTAIFYGLAKTNIQYYLPPNGYSVAMRYVVQPRAGELWKISVRYSQYAAGVKTPDPFLYGDTSNFDIKNYSFYSNTSFEKKYSNKWLISTSASYSYNRDQIRWSDTLLGTIPSFNIDYRLQVRSEVKKYLTERLSLLTGIEVQHYGYTEIFDTLNGNFTETISAVYFENLWSPLRELAIKTGLRIENSALLRHTNIQPRISLSVQTGRYSQIAAASGIYYQDPGNLYLLSGYRPLSQEAVHYILNYQWIKDSRTFRIETYYKNYRHLVRDFDSAYNPNPYRFISAGTVVDNSGYGYARGLDIFWHDKKTFKGLDYWISYSYIDTRRLYLNYLQEAQPDFVSTQNLSVVTKYFVDAWQVNFSMTWSWASGKPYYDPSGKIFFSEKTPDYQNLAFAAGYLTSIRKWFTVVYLGIDNLTNHHNIFGYRYSFDGREKYPVLPALYRSFILGINFSLSKFEKSEL